MLATLWEPLLHRVGCHHERLLGLVLIAASVVVLIVVLVTAESKAASLAHLTTHLKASGEVFHRARPMPSRLLSHLCD